MYNILGFNFTSINVENKISSPEQTRVKTDVSITDLKKDSLPQFSKDKELISLSFKFSAEYFKNEAPKDQKEKKQAKLSSQSIAQVILLGKMVLSLTKEQAAFFELAWKKKDLPQEHKLPIYNFILNKCTIKALQLEEDLGLPTHFPLPKLVPQQPDEKRVQENI